MRRTTRMDAAAPNIWDVPDLQTLLVGLVALQLGIHLCRRSALLDRLDIPAAVVGGVLMSLVTAAVYAASGVEITFATTLRDVLLLVFFVTIGLSAKLSALRAGGRPLALLCAVTVLLLVLQNLTGLAVARLFGAHPFVGLLAGSISFVGGPGTAMAWAKEATAMGVRRAPELAMAAATMAVIAGAVVSGPVTSWLLRRRGLRGPTGVVEAPWLSPRPDDTPPPQIEPLEHMMRALLLIFASVTLGDWLNHWAAHLGLVLPGFLTAMLAGVAITNIADATGVELEFAPIERNGEIALQAFLAISLMSLQLWTIADAVPPLLTNVAAQVAVTTAVALWVLFPLLGRDYDAAVAAGGFLGFGLSSMPVAMATMEQVTSRYGPAPRAFLLITLAGSFFVDLANALIVKTFLLLPMFR
jgi:ESS family glutamate:Na+ symporter